MKKTLLLITFLLLPILVFGTFTNIQDGDPGIASTVMANFKDTNYGSVLAPKDTNGSDTNNVIDLGKNTAYFKQSYITTMNSVSLASTSANTLTVVTLNISSGINYGNSNITDGILGGDWTVSNNSGNTTFTIQNNSLGDNSILQLNTFSSGSTNNVANIIFQADLKYLDTDTGDTLTRIYEDSGTFGVIMGVQGAAKDTILNIDNDGHGQESELLFSSEDNGGVDRFTALTWNPNTEILTVSPNIDIEGSVTIGAAGLIVNGNVGIGTTAPIFDLQVLAATSTWAAQIKNDAVAGHGLYISIPGTTLSYDIFNVYGGSGANQAFRITGDLRIYMPEVYNSTSGSAANVYIDSAGRLFRSTSSRRYKENIQNIQIDTSGIYDLQPVTYQSKNDNATHHGFIAEEIHEVLPGACVYDEQGRPDAIDWNVINTATIAELQYQKIEIDNLKEEIEDLKNTLSVLLNTK